MLEGLDGGGSILAVIGDDATILVDAELAPLYERLKAAITEHPNLPVH